MNLYYSCMSMTAVMFDITNENSIQNIIKTLKFKIFKTI